MKNLVILIPKLTLELNLDEHVIKPITACGEIEVRKAVKHDPQ